MTKVQGALQYPVEFGDRPKPKSVYYQVAVAPGILEADQWTESWHGTYTYCLWNIVLNGLQASGVQGEGGDTHVWGEQLVYTTPKPGLAYDYACPHQMFNNGFLIRVVLDVRVLKHKMVKEFNKCKHKHSTKLGYYHYIGYYN